MANAAEAMEERGGYVRICTGSMPVEKACPDALEIGAALPGTTCTYLEVSDTGVGMDAETMEKIYNPLFTTKEEDKGTGLGLFVVNYILDEYNGKIEVQSQQGKGTTFRVLLPVAKVPAEIADEDEDYIPL